MSLPTPAVDADSTESVPRARRGRPRGSTRGRILDIAQELFIEQGYEKTSLREIAERLGTTKAALYHHFQRKEDIILELHLRLHALGRDALDELAALQDGQEQVAAWPGLIDQFIDSVVEHQALFLLHQRNRNAFERILDNDRHRAENDDLEQRLRGLFTNPGIPLAQRVRMVCSVGAVMGPLVGADHLFADVPPAELAEIVRGAAHDVLGG
jgi:AcrR family transcriptional regulator